MKPASTPPGDARGRFLSSILFGSRWLQVPLYLGLIAAQVVYVVHFMSNSNISSSAPSR